MLRHFKMELKRQQELENQQLGKSSNLLQVTQLQQPDAASSRQARPLAAADAQALNLKRETKGQQRPEECPKSAAKGGQPNKRVRGRRSSKPAMEKRRRARINECLDILKSYVLNDTGNLNRLGIDLSLGAENRLDEDSIAREILKSSGLINRHRGRKNPNKLEKADILELTVDYVTRLHKQRDELLVTAVLAPQHQQQQRQQLQLQSQSNGCYQQQVTYSGHAQQVPAHLNEPLTLDLSPKSRLTPSTTPPTLQAYRPPPNTPLTPPSSGSSEGGNLAAYQQVSQMQLLSQVLAEGRYKLQDYVSFPPAQQK